MTRAGIRQHTKEHRKPVRNTDTSWLTQRTWKLLIISAAFADYASAGYDVVIGHGYEFGDPALEVAETYPDTKFICTEADVSADNVASYVMACEQTAM